MKRTAIMLLVLLLAAGLGVWVWKSQPPKGTADIGGAFAMVDADAKPVDEAILRGKWTAVFFGFTHCPDICPLTLTTLTDVQSQLKAKGRTLDVVFVSLDPERDTPKVLKAYLASNGMPKGIVGLTGTRAQVDAMAKAWRVYHAKAGEGDDYVIDHSSIVYLMAPDGKISAALSADESADVTTGKIDQAIRTNARL